MGSIGIASFLSSFFSLPQLNHQISHNVIDGMIEAYIPFNTINVLVVSITICFHQVLSNFNLLSVIKYIDNKWLIYIYLNILPLSRPKPVIGQVYNSHTHTHTYTDTPTHTERHTHTETQTDTQTHRHMPPKPPPPPHRHTHHFNPELATYHHCYVHPRYIANI